MSDWASVIGGLTQTQVNEAESLASRIADAVAGSSLNSDVTGRQGVSAEGRARHLSPQDIEPAMNMALARSWRFGWWRGARAHQLGTMESLIGSGRPVMARQASDCG